MDSELVDQQAARRNLFARLRDLGIETRTIDHEPVHTVADATRVSVDLSGAHTKNLFLKDAKGRLFLVVAEHKSDIDLKHLPGVIGSKRLSFGKPPLLRTMLGVEPGSVTAFAAMNDQEHAVEIVFDQNLMDFETINCHPMTNTATTNISRDDLLTFIRATGHEIKICRLEAD